MQLKKISRIVAVSGLIMLSQASFAEEKMVFKNGKGSVLELSSTKEGALTGYFTTAVASKECQQVIGQKRPVVGFLTGNAFTISIDYPDCGSALSIVGNLGKDNKTLDTTWVVVHQAAVQRKKDLGARFMGHNTYHRIS
ncbi:avidin/streptavidin family protein [Legionella cardiaca]|uniref:Avidin/streptavidin family protein n=1 Tax=Legionella cardiaca TaxID=1071983 RepID=A0ABY8ASI5_9GAMM|nr:avidin/streptavidin family protein [Legionella cardiaca]WED42736.1 avidin/streptavidin family protein [Legionella cardiaca]